MFLLAFQAQSQLIAKKSLLDESPFFILILIIAVVGQMFPRTLGGTQKIREVKYQSKNLHSIL